MQAFCFGQMTMEHNPRTFRVFRVVLVAYNDYTIVPRVSYCRVSSIIHQGLIFSGKSNCNPLTNAMASPMYIIAIHCRKPYCFGDFLGLSVSLPKPTANFGD